MFSQGKRSNINYYHLSRSRGVELLIGSDLFIARVFSELTKLQLM
jgi:hypothetical protein